MSNEADFSWRQLSDSELDNVLARRQRSDKISQIMGECLLKGHRMLATNCPDCVNILMQDKTGRQYCVACDIDKQSSTVKTSGRAQSSQQRDSEQSTIDKEQTIKSASLSESVSFGGDPNSLSTALLEAKSVLIQKLRMATKRLAEEENLATCVDYAAMIKAYADALAALGDAAKKHTINQ